MNDRRVVRFSRSASGDLRAAKSWYRKQRQGLDRRFDLAVAETIDQITEFPAAFAVIYRDVRRVLVDTFPYGIYYRERDGKLQIIGIVHLRRDPSVWQKRADED